MIWVLIWPVPGHCIFVTFSRRGSYLFVALSILTLVPEAPTVNHAHITCICYMYMLEFPSTFIHVKLCHACDELESNAKYSRFVVYFIHHECYMKFDNVRISLTSERYWYEIRDVLVPILHGVKFTKCKIYDSTSGSTMPFNWCYC